MPASADPTSPAVAPLWGVVVDDTGSPGSGGVTTDDGARVRVADAGGSDPVLRGRIAVAGAWPAGRAFAAGIRRLPPDAAAVVWLDSETAADRATIGRLATAVGQRDAAMVAAPVTEAVKRVVDGHVAGGVDRHGLCVPRAPVLVKAAPARARLLAALDDRHDPVGAVVVAALRVAIVQVPASGR